MKITSISLCLGLIFMLNACATATRGTTTLLVINTSPTGATVTTNKETKKSARISKKTRAAALAADTAQELDIAYRGCAPTPCGIEMPRRTKFDILITKPGYVPQIHSVEKIHRNDVLGRNTGKAGIAAGIGAGTGAAIGAGAGFATAGAMIVAAPVVAIGGTVLLIDAASGANYDLTPNPVNSTLLPQTDEETNSQVEGIIKNFNRQRVDKSMNIKNKTIKDK